LGKSGEEIELVNNKHMKTIISTLFGLVFALMIFGQNSIPKTKLPIGIYVKEKEFLERKPSITKAFKVVPYTDTTFYVDINKYDTIKKGITYQFLDSTPKPKHTYGFYDGVNMYFDRGDSPFDFVGKFSFITYTVRPDRNRINFGMGLLGIAVSLANRTAVNPKQYSAIFYYNRKGELTEATTQAIYWLIKNEKDFLKEWHAEKNYDNEVFKKYLIKMNERYPES
jgi:hypothetical protein